MEKTRLTAGLFCTRSVFRAARAGDIKGDVDAAARHTAYGGDGHARLLAERALEIREKVFGPEHPETAESLNCLGFHIERQGHLAEARPFYERALAINEKALGPL